MTGTNHRIALIADVHFHDPAGDFAGLGWAEGGPRLVLRPWAEMRVAGRSVNDSAMALRASLDRIAAQGIRHVVLAGDYSDDGQAENLTRLAALLHEAEARLGLRFYALPGNHDGYGVAGKHVTIRYATGPGQSQLLTSDPGLANAVLTPAMRCPGLPEALAPMADFGLRRRAGDLHWESPFGASDLFSDRRFAARSADGQVQHWLTDASYLIEPEPGLWLLMIDATVFEPRNGIADPRRKRAFHDPGDAGWSAVLRVKPFLIDWIADVLRRGRAAGKLVVPVSHYPVLPHLQHMSAVLPDCAAVRRSPVPEVATRLAAAGLRLHFGGHLHIHAQSHVQTAQGGLTDLSLSPPCAFPPAITVIEGNASALRMQSLSLADLPPDPVMAPFLRAEGAEEAADFGAALLARWRERFLTRRLRQELPAALLEGVQAHRLAELPDLLGLGGTDRGLAAWGGADRVPPDLPLAELVLVAVLLAEAGALALPHFPPDQLALWREVAGLHALSGQNRDPLALWLTDVLRLLAQSLDRAEAASGTAVLLP